MEKKAYFIDDEIYSQGKKQPPRKVYCYELDIFGETAEFYDEDGNAYHMPKSKIQYEI